MSSLDMLEVTIAADFLEKLQKLVAIFGARLSPGGQHQQQLLEAAGGALAVEIFQKMRPFIWQCANDIATRNVSALKAHADTQAQQAGPEGEGALTEALQLWDTSAQRDKRKAFQLADALVTDVREWVDMGGCV